MVCCDAPPPAPLPPGSFAFGVFGDGPYLAIEEGRYRRVVEDVNAHDLQWFLHVGDILSRPCSDELYAERLASLRRIRHPVVYTPGDNEWADCHARGAGGYDPLERLARIRSLFFARPDRSLGGRSMELEVQSADPAYAEFVENARWRRGGFLFATLHMVGSSNAAGWFAGRTAAHDREVARRTQAALAWMEEAFALARSERLNGVVLALHGNPRPERDAADRPGYEEFGERLARLAAEYEGSVLLIHGDTHRQRVDQPLLSRETSAPLSNFTRLETYGAPDIGWVRVVVDSVAGRIVAYEPRLVPAWRIW